MEALYTLDGDLATSTELTRGPWDRGAQHGGAPAALAAYLVEGTPTREPMRVVRITVEFLRPVPIAPLQASVAVARDGRRIQLVEAELRHEQEPVVRTRALRIRVAKDAPSAVLDDRDGAPPAPETGTINATPFGVTRPWLGEDAVEVRFVSGAFEDPGPAIAWYRLRVPVVAGVPVTPLQRAVCAADFGNGASSVLDWARCVFINPDLTLYLEREPVGEWICLDSRTTVDRSGIGLAQSVVRDEIGSVGRAVQALYIAPR